MKMYNQNCCTELSHWEANVRGLNKKQACALAFTTSGKICIVP